MKLDKAAIRRIVLTQIAGSGEGKYIPIGISARHVHLSAADLAVLFGEGSTLHPIRALTQPGQFAAREQVTVVGPGGSLEHVRVLGPTRAKSQIEISVSDSFKIGVKKCPIRLSGDLDGSMGVTLIGPKGRVTLDEGLIVAARHIHMSEAEALVYGVHDRQVVAVRVGGERPCTLENVICRVGSGHALELHLDTDEANACGLGADDLVGLVSSGEISPPLREAERSQAVEKRNLTDGTRCHPMAASNEDCDFGSRNADASGLPDYMEGYRPCIPKVWREPTPAQKHAAPIVSGADAAACGEPVLELVTERDINDAFRDNKKQIYCEKKALITPAARERAEAMEIKIIRVRGGGTGECR
ncbi:MAG: phosphate propanoyltransferase [Clostridiales bacterium]|nr:phosphate propanoyltransferase [Clostridiales bacterium]